MINGLPIQGFIVILIKWESSLQKEAIKKSNNNLKQNRNGNINCWRAYRKAQKNA